MPTKESKTAKELETAISSHLGGLDVTVYNDPMSGWTATVFGPPVAKYPEIIQIVSELHAKYDLKEEAETPVVGAEVGPTAAFAEPSTAGGGQVE